MAIGQEMKTKLAIKKLTTVIDLLLYTLGIMYSVNSSCVGFWVSSYRSIQTM